MLQTFLSPEALKALNSLDALLELTKKRHPEQVGVLEAFTPLVKAHMNLRYGWQQVTRLRKPYTAATLPMNANAALHAANKLAEALIQGFPQAEEDIQAAQKALSQRPSPIKALCQALLGNDDQVVLNFAHKHKLSEGAGLAMLRLLILQVARAMAVKASVELRQGSEADLANAQNSSCPCCASPADMSILYEKEGKRLLHCSLCGNTWRFSRTTCPYCGVDKPENIELVFVEGCPEERAELCGTCQRYLLSVDVRVLDIPVELAYYATLGMCHLDALAQDKAG